MNWICRYFVCLAHLAILAAAWDVRIDGNTLWALMDAIKAQRR